jgi:hypothetical protein
LKTKKPQTAATPSSPQQHSRETNTADVLINLTNKMYDLVNSGNIIGVFLILLLLIVWKLPPQDINSHVTTAMNFFTAEKYYFFPMGGVLSFSVYINFFQKKTYRAEIKRHVELRRELIHGLKSGKLHELPDHTSSKYDPQED